MLSTVGISYQDNWWEVVQTQFMQYAFIGGSIVAIAAGLIGYFVIVRGSMFSSHALAHIGFPGATGAALIGVPVSVGLLVFTVAGAIVIGLLGKRAAEREIATGTVLAFATGLGVLFTSLASQNTQTLTNVLFGNLLAITTDQLLIFAALMVVLLVVLAAVFRPLLFTSVDAQVAEAKGLNVRALGLLFMVLLAVVITMAVQVVGVLLLFGLVVTPAAAGLRITARPAGVVVISVAIALASVWVGLLVAAMFNLPPSFFVIAMATAIWSVTLFLTRERLSGSLKPDASQTVASDRLAL